MIMEATDGPAILISDHLSPIDVQGRISELAEIAKKKGQYIIAVTKESISSWSLKPHERNFLWSIPLANLYNGSQLWTLFKSEIDKHRKDLKLHPDLNFSESNAVGAEWTYRLEGLKGPNEVYLLVHQLLGEQGMVTRATIAHHIEEVKKHQDALVQLWFQSSTEKEKMVLIGASLFSGLFEEQFFELFDEIIQKRWKHRVPSLQALDYCDLDAIDNFFHFEDSPQGTAQVKSQLESLEREIIASGWKGYRRHMLASLPLIKEAIAQSSKYGRSQGMVLRKELARSLANMGAWAEFEIDELLDHFSSRSNQSRRRVAAYAVAHWRDTGEWEKAITTIDRWIQHQNVSPRLTAIMSISYVSEKDQHNQLASEIIEWLRILYRDRSITVQGSLKPLLTKLIRNHPRQMAPLIQVELLSNQDQIEPVSEGLKDAYRYYPDQAINIIESWIEEALRVNARTGVGIRTTRRDRFLLAALWALVKIQAENRNIGRTSEQMLARLISIRSEETQEAVLKGIGQMVVFLFRHAEAPSLDLLLDFIQQKNRPEDRFAVWELILELLNEEKVTWSRAANETLIQCLRESLLYQQREWLAFIGTTHELVWLLDEGLGIVLAEIFLAHRKDVESRSLSLEIALQILDLTAFVGEAPSSLTQEVLGGTTGFHARKEVWTRLLELLDQGVVIPGEELGETFMDHFLESSVPERVAWMEFLEGYLTSTYILSSDLGEKLLQMFVDHRAVETTPQIIRTITDIALQIMEISGRINRAILIQLLQDSKNFEERLVIWEKTAHLLRLGKLQFNNELSDLLITTMRRAGNRQRPRLVSYLGSLLPHLWVSQERIANDFLDHLLEFLSFSTRPRMAQVLGKVFLLECSRQKGGAWNMQVEELEIPFFPQGRPLTRIEAKMFDYLERKGRKERKLAVIAGLEFSYLLMDVESYAKRNGKPVVVPLPVPQSVVPKALDQPQLLAQIVEAVRVAAEDREAAAEIELSVPPLPPPVIPQPTFPHEVPDYRSKDPADKLPWVYRFLGFLFTLFSPQTVKSGLWVAISGFLYFKRYSGRHIIETLRQWRSSRLPVTVKMAKKLNWINLFAPFSQKRH